ncbi:hypothetical protein AAKU61_003247, partial [Undibacterium sp. GrIS 1.2]
KIKPALLNHTFERKSIKITKSARYLGFMEGLLEIIWRPELRGIDRVWVVCMGREIS